MPSGGRHIPDFGWDDPDGSSIIDWGFLEDVTTIPPTTGPFTTEPPVTGPPGGLPGARVAGGMVYRNGVLCVRVRGELGNGHRATATLQPPLCLLEVIDENGFVYEFFGRRDPVDPSLVRFLARMTLSAPRCYLARVTLALYGGGSLGPRTFSLVVS